MSSNHQLTTRPEGQQLAVSDPTGGAMSIEQMLVQVQLIQQAMSAVMRDKEHFGTIPGCGTKPTLLKPGAEKLCMMFRLAPTYDVIERELEKGHREYRVQCTLSSILSGVFLGQGVGTCSTMEAKYRYRGKAGRECPKCHAHAIIKGRQEYGGGWVCFKKKDGCGANFKDGDKSIEDQSDERQENPDLADQYNTVLKMSKKRALVDAVLTATAASDIFSQDLEDISANLAAARPADDAAIEAREAKREQSAREVQSEAVQAPEPVAERIEALVHDVRDCVSRAGRKYYDLDFSFPPAHPTGKRTASTFSSTVAAKARKWMDDDTSVLASIVPGKKQGFFELKHLESAEVPPVIAQPADNNPPWDADPEVAKAFDGIVMN